MNNHRNEKGYTLVGVLLVFTILAILGMSLVMLSFASVKTSTTERDHQSVYYIAEAGLNYEIEKINQAVQESDKRIEKEFAYLQHDENATEEDYQAVINTEINRIDNFLNQYQEITESPIQFEKVNNIEPRAEIQIIEVAQNNDANEYELKSTGIIDEQSRTVTSQFQIGWDLVVEEVPDEPIPVELPPYAVFTSGSMKLKNGSIIGDIGTLSTEKDTIIKIDDDFLNLDGDIFVPGGDTKIVKNSNYYSKVKSIDLTDSIPELPEFPASPLEIKSGQKLKLKKDTELDMTIKESVAYEELEIEKGKTLTIDLGGRSRSIYIEKDFEMEENSNIIIKNSGDLTFHVGKDFEMDKGSINMDGSGDLTFHIGKDFEMDKGSLINIGDSGNLSLHAGKDFELDKGSKIGNENNIKNINAFIGKDFELDDGSKFFGSIYVDTGKVKVEKKSTVYGNVFTRGDKVEINGSPEEYPRLILAPNAEVEVEEKDSGNLHGMIIAKSFELEEDVTVKFTQDFYVKHGLISVEGLGDSNDDSNSGSSGGVKVIEAGFNMIQTDSIREE